MHVHELRQDLDHAAGPDAARHVDRQTLARVNSSMTIRHFKIRPSAQGSNTKSTPTRDSPSSASAAVGDSPPRSDAAASSAPAGAPAATGETCDRCQARAKHLRTCLTYYASSGQASGKEEPLGQHAERRPFRYSTVQKQNRDNVYLVRELVKCGRPRCRCASGLKHGPYFYLRYEEWDRTRRRTYSHREYVPQSEVLRVVRRWVRRCRTKDALARGVLGLLRRHVREAEARARRRAALSTITARAPDARS